MNRYEELKNRFQKEIDAFPMKFAFSQEQFVESMRELGLDSTDTDKIIGIPCGGFIRKSDKQAFIDLFCRKEKAMEAAIAEDVDGSGFVCDMFRYELANHEYIITHSLHETLDALCYSEEEVATDPKLANGLALARKLYMQEADEKGWG